MYSQIEFYEMLPLHPRLRHKETITSYVTRVFGLNRIKHWMALSELFFPDSSKHIGSTIKDYPPSNILTLCQLTNNTEQSILSATFHYLGKNFGRGPLHQSLSRFLNRAVGSELRYCPRCLCEEPYYRLPWRFLHITACPIHCCKLLNYCGFCGRYVKLAPSFSQIGVCPWCGMALWKSSSSRFIGNLDALEKEYLALEILLSPVADWSKYGRCNFTEFLGASLWHYRQVRDIPVSVIQNRTGLDSFGIRTLELGRLNKRRLRLIDYYQYLAALDLSMYDVLVADPLPVMTTKVSDDNTQWGIHNPWGARETMYVEKVIDAIHCLKRDGDATTTAAIARRVGVSAPELYRYKRVRVLLPNLRPYPDDRYYLSPDRMLEMVKTAWSELLTCDQQPTNKAIALHLGISRIDHYPQVRDWLRETRAEFTRLQNQIREKMLLDQLLQVEDSLKSSDVMPCLSVIASKMGISPQKLSYAVSKIPSLRLSIEKIRTSWVHNPLHNKRKERELLSKVEKACAELTSLGIPLTQVRVAQMLGRSIPGLRSYSTIKEILDKLGRNYRERGKNKKHPDVS